MQRCRRGICAGPVSDQPKRYHVAQYIREKAYLQVAGQGAERFLEHRPLHPQLVGLATQNLRAHRGGELLSSGRVSVLSADGWEGWAGSEG